MYTYKFILYSRQVFQSYSTTDSRIVHKEERYLQILGVAKVTPHKNVSTSFFNIDLTGDSQTYKGYRLYVLTKKGNPKKMASPIKEIRIEKL